MSKSSEKALERKLTPLEQRAKEIHDCQHRHHVGVCHKVVCLGWGKIGCFLAEEAADAGVEQGLPEWEG